MTSPFVSHPPPADLRKDLPADRWEGIARPYSPADVVRLRGSLRIAHTLAERGARRLWEQLRSQPYVHALGRRLANTSLLLAR